jgi:hypothetical protein
MESIVVSLETGLVNIGRFSFHPRLTYREVEFNYPNLKRELSKSLIRPHAYIYLPKFEFLNYHTEARLTSYDRYISSISFSRVVEQAIDDATYEKKLHEMVVWTRHIKSWLSTQFGTPHRIKPPVLMDEKRWLSPDEIAHLDYWIYSQAWGEFGYSFHWQTSASVHFHFDIPYRIQNWEGLRDECRYLAQVNQWHIERKMRNQPYIEAAIDVLSAHYDYVKVRALIAYDLRCLSFDLPQRSSKVIVYVRPNHPDKPYRIERSDRVRKVYTTAENLVEALRVFLEAENL